MLGQPSGYRNNLENLAFVLQMEKTGSLMTGKHRAMTAGLISLIAAAGAAAADRGGKEHAIAAVAASRAGNVHGAIHSDDLIGANIRNGRDEAIGEIDGLLVSTTGGPIGVVVEVGGFLGVGTRQIVVPLDQVILADNRVMIPEATKEELERAQPYVKPKTSMLR